MKGGRDQEQRFARCGCKYMRNMQWNYAGLEPPSERSWKGTIQCAWIDAGRGSNFTTGEFSTTFCPLSALGQGPTIFMGPMGQMRCFAAASSLVWQVENIIWMYVDAPFPLLLSCIPFFRAPSSPGRKAGVPRFIIVGAGGDIREAGQDRLIYLSFVFKLWY